MIANVEFVSVGVFGDPSKIKMYREEQPEFEEALGFDELNKRWASDNYATADEIDADRKLLELWLHLRSLLKEN